MYSIETKPTRNTKDTNTKQFYSVRFFLFRFFSISTDESNPATNETRDEAHVPTQCVLIRSVKNF